MIERYALVSGRIRQELENLERVVSRVEQAVAAAQRHPVDQDFYLDSAALNLHDFYAGLERVFRHIAAHVDRSVPESGEWHRELLLQMGLEAGPFPLLSMIWSVWPIWQLSRSTRSRGLSWPRATVSPSTDGTRCHRPPWFLRQRWRLPGVASRRWCNGF